MAAEPARGKNAGLFQKLAENDRYRKIIVIAGIIGILLILVSGSLKSCDTSQNSQPQSASSQTAVTADQYAKALETDLTGIISQISGVGNAKVLVTLDQTAKSVYATEEKQSRQQTSEKADSQTGKSEEDYSDETNYLLIKNSDGSEQALRVTEIQPLVKGVVVVCDGGDDPKVQQSVTDAVTTALHITSVRVCVIKAK